MPWGAVLSLHMWRLLTSPLAYVFLSRFPDKMGYTDNSYSVITLCVFHILLVFLHFNVSHKGSEFPFSMEKRFCGNFLPTN